MIPLAKDVREAIGDFAGQVENRSLLFEKMVLPKTWGHAQKFDDATRFNVMRASTDGKAMLQADAKSARKSANSPRAREENKEQNRRKADIADALSKGVNLAQPGMAKLRVGQTNRLLTDLQVSYGNNVKTFVGTLGGRLLINMAGGVMENAGLALDRTSGLPVIPGSALKGVSRNAALWDIRRTTDPDEKLKKLRHALLVFGFIKQDLTKGDFAWVAGSNLGFIQQALGEEAHLSEFKGLCSFLPAYPASADRLEIVAEVLTSHVNPERILPIFFPAVEAGSSFGFAVCRTRTAGDMDIDYDAVLASAAKWLQMAITENGVGAKTATGYGWFSIDAQAEERRQQEAAQQAEAETERLAAEAKAAADAAAREQARAAMTPEERRADEFGTDEEAAAALGRTILEQNKDEQKAILIYFQNHPDFVSAWKKAKKKNKAHVRYQNLLKASEALGIPLEKPNGKN